MPLIVGLGANKEFLRCKTGNEDSVLLCANNGLTVVDLGLLLLLLLLSLLSLPYNLNE